MDVPVFPCDLPQELINGENMVTAKKQMPQIVHLFNRKHKLFAETYITFPFLPLPNEVLFALCEIFFFEISQKTFSLALLKEKLKEAFIKKSVCQ